MLRARHRECSTIVCTNLTSTRRLEEEESGSTYALEDEEGAVECCLVSMTRLVELSATWSSLQDLHEGKPVKLLVMGRGGDPEVLLAAAGYWRS